MDALVDLLPWSAHGGCQPIYNDTGAMVLRRRFTILSPAFFLLPALVGLIGLVLVALVAADLLILGPRPSGPLRRVFFQGWWVSAVLGLLVGGFVAFWHAHVYTRYKDFYAAFHATPLAGRLALEKQRRNVPLSLPSLIATVALASVCGYLGVALIPALLALLIPQVFVLPAAARVREAAQVLRGASRE
jgi:hypothetical protein